jgi:hypothetical protein
VVKPGARLPAVEGEAVRGETSSLPPKRRWTLVLIPAPWCAGAGCDGGWDELSSGSHEGVLVLSAMAGIEETRATFSSWTSDVPVLHVQEAALKGWDLGAVPTWIVFDEDGVVIDAAVARLQNLDEVLTAIAADRKPPALESDASS